MNKFTPGPWKFEQSDNWYIRDAAGNAFQCDEHYYPWVSSNIADWHLIAAAPEMYEALDPDSLEAIADEIDCFEHSLRAHSLRVIAKQQRAALAKAEGQ